MLIILILQFLLTATFSTLFTSYDDILKISTTVQTIAIDSEINTIKFQYHEARSVVFILNINETSNSNFVNLNLHNDIPNGAISLEHNVEMGILKIQGTPKPPGTYKPKENKGIHSTYIYISIVLIFSAIGIFIHMKRKRSQREIGPTMVSFRVLFVCSLFIVVSNFIPKYAEIYVIINLNNADLLPKLIINEYVRKPFCLSKRMLQDNIGCTSLEDYSREVEVNQDL